MNPADVFSSSDKLIEANSLNGMGHVLEKKHEYEDAQRAYEEALALYEEIFGAHHLTTALLTRNLARVLRILGKTAEAALLEDHAKDIFANRGADTDSEQRQFGGSCGFFNLIGFESSEADQVQNGDDEHLGGDCSPIQGS